MIINRSLKKTKRNLERNPDTCIAYTYNIDGSYEKRLFENSASNIANFIMLKDGAEKIIITDRLDQLVVSTFGYFIDMCPDKSLLNEILKVLIPLQNYEKEPEEVISIIWQ